MADTSDNLFLLLLATCCYGQPPIQIPPKTTLPDILPQDGNSCFSSLLMAQHKQDILLLLQTTVNLRFFSPSSSTCGCGGADWIRVASLDMTQPTTVCPSGWTLYPSPRSCGRNSTQLQALATFTTQGRTYSHVCGKVLAYQKGHPDAFGASVIRSLSGIDGVYMDGVSVTHGSTTRRTHVWSFSAGAYAKGDIRIPTCPCSNSDPHPATVPTFVGDKYFCETGNSGSSFSSTTVYHNDPLWDSKGCGPNSMCCEHPPYFCSSLPQATSDDLEVRIISDELASGEDTRVFVVELYTK